MLCKLSLNQLTKLPNQSDLQPRSEPALELHSRAASSVGVMYRSSGPNTGGIYKKNMYHVLSLETNSSFTLKT